MNENHIEHLKILIKIQAELQEIRASQGVIEGLRMFCEEQQTQFQEQIFQLKEELSQNKFFPISFQKVKEMFSVWMILDIVLIEFLLGYAFYWRLKAEFIPERTIFLILCILEVGTFLLYLGLNYYDFAVDLEGQLLKEEIKKKETALAQWKEDEKTLKDSFNALESLREQWFQIQRELYNQENVKEEDQDPSSIHFFLKVLEKEIAQELYNEEEKFDPSALSSLTTPAISAKDLLSQVKQHQVIQIQEDVFKDLLSQQESSFYSGREKIWGIWTMDLLYGSIPQKLDLTSYFQEKEAVLKQIQETNKNQEALKTVSES